MNLRTFLRFFIILLASLVFTLADCLPARADNSGMTAPDDSNKSLKTMTLEAGARLLQDKSPVMELQTYLDGFHNSKREANLPGEQQHQMRVSHYCQNLSEDFIQCAVYDGNMKMSHLIGIEYVVSDRVYASLPDEEKNYWHSHVGEVDSGLVMAPGIPDAAHKALMDRLRSTHGKTWNVWDIQKAELPVGEPVLMWSIEPDRINTQTRQVMQARAESIEF